MVMQLRALVFALATNTVFLSACADFSDVQEGDAQEEGVASAQSALNQTFAQHQTACQADPRVQAGVVSLTECIGADIFLRPRGSNILSLGSASIASALVIPPRLMPMMPRSSGSTLGCEPSQATARRMSKIPWVMPRTVASGSSEIIRVREPGVRRGP